MFGKHNKIKRADGAECTRVFVPESTEVDLDALNGIAQGGAAGFCACRYTFENGCHVFEYSRNNAETADFPGFGEAEAKMLAAALLQAVLTAKRMSFNLANIQTDPVCIFRGSDGYRFIYVPVTCEDGADDANRFITDFIKKYKKKQELFKQILKELKQSSDALAVLEKYSGSPKKTAASADDSEAETTVISQSPSYDSEGETTVLSQSPSYDSEGETTVLSQSPSYDSEGETTVLSQSPSYDSEGETTVLSQSPSYDSEGETTVLNGAAGKGTQYFDREELSSMIQRTFAEENKDYAPVAADAPQKSSAGNTTSQALQVILVSADNRGRYEITGAGADIGSADSAGTITLRNSSVSRRHAGIKIEDGHVFVTDYGSTNGTYVDGVEIEPQQKTEIYNGSFLSFGNESFQLMVKRV